MTDQTGNAYGTSPGEGVWPMSDEPMMQQISVRFMQPEEEAYINGRIAEAVQAERDRVRQFGKYRRTKLSVAICPFFVWQSENIGEPDKTPKEGDVSLVFCDHPDNPDKYEGNCAVHLCPLAAVEAKQKEKTDE